MKSLDHQITLSLSGLPDDALAALLEAYRDRYDALEITVPWRVIPSILPGLGNLRDRLGRSLFLTRMVSWADPDTGSPGTERFYRYGVTPDALPSCPAPFDTHALSRYLDGISVEVAPHVFPWDARKKMASAGFDPALVLLYHVRIGPSNRTDALRDDVAIGSRVAETTMTAFADAPHHWLLDTFIDHDRGHGLRHGLLDRRYTPRPQYHVLANLTALFGNGIPPLKPHCIRRDEDLRVFSLNLNGHSSQLYLPQSRNTRSVPAPGAGEWLELGVEHQTRQPLKSGSTVCVRGPGLFIANAESEPAT